MPFAQSRTLQTLVSNPYIHILKTNVWRRRRKFWYLRRPKRKFPFTERCPDDRISPRPSGWAHRSEIASWRLRRQNFPSRSYREETRFFVSYRARIGGDPPTPSFPYFNIEVFVTRCRGLPETCVTVSEQLSGCLITYQKFELDIQNFYNVPPMPLSHIFSRLLT